MDKKIEGIILEFSKIEEIEGILLAGSRAVKAEDSKSDYDIYVYSSKEVPVAKRRNILEKYCSYMEIDNKFWETEDDVMLKDSTIVEFIYRDMNWIKDNLNRVLVEHKASIGYTTCFWSNIKNSIILYDKNGKLNEIQKKCDISFPKELKENIIKENYKLLKDKIPAYYSQIEKALQRQDIISVNHRVAEFFASYFDIIFAANEMPHPGEKKIIKIIKDNNLKTPNNMFQDVENILKYSGTGELNILKYLDSLIENLDEYLSQY